MSARGAAVLLCAIATACAAASGDDGDDDESTSGGHVSPGSSAVSTITDGGGPPGPCNDFICEPDGGGTMWGCDPFAENCPAGFKCMPWANDGGSVWNATKCSPVAPDPNQPGDPCTAEGSGVSGVDDCDVHTMCWNVDPRTNTGTCIAMCVGTPANAFCENPCEVCQQNSEGVFNPCIPTCDPFVQDCAEGEGCYPNIATFLCANDASGPDLGAVGDPCDYLNSCDPGLFCADAETVPGCTAEHGCCTPFCNPEIADSCPASLVGAECVPWVELLGPCYSTPVGSCVLP